MSQFETAFAEYTGIPHCLATCSGTAALHLALKVAGIGKDDEVWCPTLTFIGGVSPVLWVGAKPVFFDCDEYLTIDVSLFRGRKPPRAIIATDLFGQSCDWPALRTYCDLYDVILIADSAEAVGSFYCGRHSGYYADIAIYSFNNNKIITTLGGGMIASHSAEMIDKARYYATQAREPVGWYEHKEIGFNYRMNGYAEAAGVTALKEINAKVARHRAEADRYAKVMEIIQEPPGSTGNRWMTVARCAELRPIRDRGVDVRPMFKPMHLQPVFRNAEVVGGHFAENAFGCFVCIPFGVQQEVMDYLSEKAA